MEGNNKIKFSDKLKDKRERAKIELICYGIFFVIVVIFARVTSGKTAKVDDNNFIVDSFIYDIEDNYEYSIVLSTSDNIYEYYGKRLGNNMTINMEVNGVVSSYRLIGNKYYVLEDNNYILTSKDSVYPYIDYRYLDINNIREYMDLASVDGNIYRVKISDIVLGSDTPEYLEIRVEEGDFNIVIDYSSLLGLNDNNKEKVMVSITYSNINKIISLDE